MAQVRAPRDTADAIKRVAEIASAAANDGVALVVFPEALLAATPGEQDLAPWSASGRGWAARSSWPTVGRPSPAPVRAQLGDIAAERALHLVVGFIERAGTSLYRATATFDDTGSLDWPQTKSDAHRE